MQAEELKSRTKQFALRTLRLYRSLPRSAEAQIIGKQLLRSSTSVAANYRSVCRSRSGAEFVSRMAVVVEEADESSFWLELLHEGAIVPQAKLANLLKEADELTAIFNASRTTAAKSKIKNQQV